MKNSATISTLATILLASSLTMAQAKATKKSVKSGNTVELGQFHKFAPNTCDTRRVIVNVPLGADMGKIHVSRIQKRIRDANSECDGMLVPYAKVDYRAGYRPGTDIVTINVTYVAGGDMQKVYEVSIKPQFE